jgi:hypothetical protein|tara:strand:+ start:2493 stop:2696 length:204 start_codon:yes stop_codon:yes gene_type:complete
MEIIGRKLRKKKHVNYISAMLTELHIELINTCIVSSRIGWTDEAISKLGHLSNIIRKYERRIRILKY